MFSESRDNESETEAGTEEAETKAEAGEKEH
jgi:hypothetical protein